MKSYREKLEEVYRNLVEPAFAVDERMPLHEFCEYFISDKYASHHHIEFDDRYCLLWCDLDNGIKCIEFLVVSPKERNRGLGGRIFSEWLERNGHPNLMMEVDGDRAMKFWNRYGIKPVRDYQYVQPPLKEGMNPVDWLTLSTNFDQTKEETDRMIRSWFKYGFGLDDRSK